MKIKKLHNKFYYFIFSAIASASVVGAIYYFSSSFFACSDNLSSKYGLVKIHLKDNETYHMDLNLKLNVLKPEDIDKTDVDNVDYDYSAQSLSPDIKNLGYVVIDSNHNVQFFIKPLNDDFLINDVKKIQQKLENEKGIIRFNYNTKKNIRVDKNCDYFISAFEKFLNDMFYETNGRIVSSETQNDDKLVK